MLSYFKHAAPANLPPLTKAATSLDSWNFRSIGTNRVAPVMHFASSTSTPSSVKDVLAGQLTGGIGIAGVAGVAGVAGIAGIAGMA